MHKAIKEQYLLILSIFRWGLLASLIGGVTGLLTTLFLKTLSISTSYLQSYAYYFLLLPLVFFISGLIIQALPDDLEGQGKVIEKVHKNAEKISLVIVPIRFIAAIVTLAFGGSAGKVGPCAQMGAGMASSIGETLKLKKDDRRMLIICGISAGFSSVFGTPIAGAIFAIEVLVLGRVLNNYLFPVLISSLVAYKITSYFGIDYHHYHIVVNQSENLLFYSKVALSGFYFGIIALLFIEILSIGNKLANRINISKPLKGFIGGSILILLVYLFHSTMFLGLGSDTINTALQGNRLPLYAFLLKIVFVAITLSFGGSGGVITPLFFIGTSAGISFGLILNLDLSVMAAIGLVALLAGATNTPIASIVMSVEMFGQEILPYAAISCIISYIIAGHRSIYPTQLIGASKSNLIKLPLNKPIKNT
ncbi:chloride channel protein [Mycoplasmatota bacterium]|nr:chloride channel protein [Mycoplasmatota bacterium]